jgi:hypothetical protein
MTLFDVLGAKWRLVSIPNVVPCAQEILVERLSILEHKAQSTIENSLTS